MSHIPTLAIEINEQNYPIAVACLPGGFAANHPRKSTYGSILIINELEAVKVKKQGRVPTLAYGNCWMSREQFFERFEVVSESARLIDNEFVEVERI